VTTVKKQEGLVGWFGWQPGAVKKSGSIPAFKRLFSGLHGDSLTASRVCRELIIFAATLTDIMPPGPARPAGDRD